MNVTDAMVHAYSKAYDKNWDEQSRAPESSTELGTFFAMRAGLQAALAARQPVGEPVAYVEFLDRQNDSLRRAIHAIMAKLAFLLDEDQFADVDAIALAAGVAPPAQAVDLGEFRRPVESWKRKRERSLRQAINAGKASPLIEGLRRDLADADRLLALIDSQAVGK